MLRVTVVDHLFFQVRRFCVLQKLKRNFLMLEVSSEYKMYRSTNNDALNVIGSHLVAVVVADTLIFLSSRFQSILWKEK